ncbi:MAG TPA: hypothetical protein PLS10_07080 [Chitinophagales bacterium]|nr:hypothetical protein [Chitinophagales bacterium]
MAGIAFYINNEQLQLSSEQKISISLENPLLSDKTIPGAVSFPFNIAASATNKRLLNISDTLMSFDEYQNIKCHCYLGGNLWRAGYLIINTHSAKSINITFTEFNSEEDFDDKTLQDLDFPILDSSEVFYDQVTEERSLLHSQLNARAYRNWDTYGITEKDFVCPTVFNVKTLDVTNNVGFQNVYAKGKYVPDFTTELNNNTISPFLFVNYVIEKLFKFFNLKVEKNILKKDDLDDLCLYTNKAIIMYTEYVYDPSLHNYCIFMESSINLKEYAPLCSLTDFLTALKKSFNLAYFINWGNKKVDIICKSDVLKNNKIVNITNIAEPFENMAYKNSFKSITSVVYAKQTDAIITDDENRFSLKGYNYKGWLLYGEDIPDIPHKTNDYYIQIILGYNTIDTHNIFYYDADGTWKTLKPRVKDSRPYDVYFTNDKKENKLELGIDTTVVRINSTLYNLSHADEPDTIEEINLYKYFCPAVDIGIATNKSFFGNKTDIDVDNTIRLLFYRGMRQEINDGGYFPYANRNEFDFIVENPGVPDDDNDTSPAPVVKFFNEFEHSLEIDGPKGLWQKFHVEWQEFLSKLSRLATYNVRWSAAQLQDESIFQDFLQINGNRFIASKITITADVNTIYPCKTEMYQIEPK